MLDERQIGLTQENEGPCFTHWRKSLPIRLLGRASSRNLHTISSSYTSTVEPAMALLCWNPTHASSTEHPMRNHTEALTGKPLESFQQNKHQIGGQPLKLPKEIPPGPSVTLFSFGSLFCEYALWTLCGRSLRRTVLLLAYSSLSPRSSSSVCNWCLNRAPTHTLRATLKHFSFLIKDPSNCGLWAKENKGWAE